MGHLPWCAAHAQLMPQLGAFGARYGTPAHVRRHQADVADKLQLRHRYRKEGETTGVIQANREGLLFHHEGAVHQDIEGNRRHFIGEVGRLKHIDIEQGGAGLGLESKVDTGFAWRNRGSAERLGPVEAMVPMGAVIGERYLERAFILEWSAAQEVFEAGVACHKPAGHEIDLALGIDQLSFALQDDPGVGTGVARDLDLSDTGGL